MDATKSSLFMKRFVDYDLALCLFFNRAVHRRVLHRTFAAISRLGDGLFWYALMGALPLVYGLEGLTTALHMGLVGLVGVLLYKALKGWFIRERPFVTHTIIQLGARPLDRHSFPSGHTLHAVGFTLVVLGYHWQLGLVLVPFALLVAMSRLVLGLHYPSDVLSGAAIGSTLALLSFRVLPWLVG